jgi:hypothetical protein
MVPDPGIAAGKELFCFVFVFSWSMVLSVDIGASHFGQHFHDFFAACAYSFQQLWLQSSMLKCQLKER